MSPVKYIWFLQQCAPMRSQIGQFKPQIVCTFKCRWKLTLPSLIWGRRLISSICKSDSKVASPSFYSNPVLLWYQKQTWSRESDQLSLKQALTLLSSVSNSHTLRYAAGACFRHCRAAPVPFFYDYAVQRHKLHYSSLSCLCTKPEFASHSVSLAKFRIVPS